MKSFKKRDERGFVVVLMAISMLALITVMGLAIDVGSWYLAASRLQRAADGAALAGAISLPDSSASNAAVTESLAHNNVSNGNAGITATSAVASDGKSISVYIKNTNVPTYFSHYFLPSLTISRHSIAQSSTDAPALGSPYNVLGAGPLSNGTSVVPTQKFWLAIAGGCDPPEDGDLFNAVGSHKAGLVEPTTTSATGQIFTGTYNDEHICGQAADANAYYNHGRGYTYYVNVPPGDSTPVNISVWDGSYHPRSTSNGMIIDKLTGFYPAGKDQFVAYDTDYLVRKPDGSIGRTGGGNLPTTMGFIDDRDTGWTSLYKLSPQESMAGGVYSVQVYIDGNSMEPNVDQLGMNSFSLAAFRNNHDGCDTRTSTTCPEVSGQGAMSVYTEPSSGAGTAKFYFAKISPTMAGQTFNIYLWDPGDGGTQDIKLQDEYQAQHNSGYLSFQWEASGANHPYPLSLPTTSLDVNASGPCPLAQADPCAGLTSNYKFNDRLVTLKVQVPTNYAQDVANSDDWVLLEYDLTDPATGDHTTWGASVAGGSFAPPQLVNQ